MRSFCVLCGTSLVIPQDTPVPIICGPCRGAATEGIAEGKVEKMGDPKRGPNKCECEECDCPSATTDVVCYECLRGFHVTHWHEGEVVRARGRKPCPLCGQYPCDCARDV